MNVPLKYWLFIFTLGTVWGASFLFAKIAVAEIAPVQLVFLRVFIAAILLWIWVLLRGQKVRLEWPAIRHWLVLGLLANALPFCFLFYGQQHIGAGLASIVNASTVLWTALFAHLLLKDEKLTPQKTLGVIIGFLGIVVLVGPSALEGLGENVWAQIFVVLATMSYAVATIYSRKTKGYDPVVTAAGQLSMAALWVLPMVYIVSDGTMPSMPSTKALLALAGLSVISTAFAYALFFKVVAVVGALNVALCTLIVPVVAVLLGKIVLAENLTPNQYFGMISILLGLIIIDGRLKSLIVMISNKNKS